MSGLKRGNAILVPGDRPERDADRGSESRNILARAVGYGSGRQLERVQTIAEDDPVLFEKVNSGELSVNAAYTALTKPRGDERGARQPAAPSARAEADAVEPSDTPQASTLDGDAAVSAYAEGIGPAEEICDVPRARGLDWRVVYISCPYVSGDAVRKARRYINTHADHMRFAFGEGAYPITAHESLRNYLDSEKPDDWQLALDLGMNLLRRCDELWVFGGSVDDAMAQQIAEAVSAGKPVRYYDANHEEVSAYV
jgi:hypothetical protein